MEPLKSTQAGGITDFKAPPSGHVALVAEAGWSKAEYDMTGCLTILTAFVLPALR